MDGKAVFKYDESLFLCEAESLAHPLAAALEAEGVAVKAGHFGFNADLFAGLQFVHGAMKFTIRVSSKGHVLLAMLERVGNLHGLRATWRDLDWFADFCKARPETGVTWLLGKIKPYSSGPGYASEEKLRQFYTRVTNCVSLGWDGSLEWVGVDIRDHEPLHELRRRRLAGESLNAHNSLVE